jgi:hypothetical protein
MAGHVARMGVNRGVQRVLVVKPEGKMPLARPMRRGGRGDWMELASCEVYC